MSKSRKIAVVTGSASGIGASVASRLSSGGWTVIGLDRQNADETRVDLRDPSLSHRHCNVASMQSVQAAFEAVASEFSYVDALICCAGVLKIGALSEMDVDDFDDIFNVNTRGPWLCIREAIPLMRKSPNRAALPRIVVVGSIAAIRPKVGNGAYGAQKAALHNLVRVLGTELGPDGILINAVAPGTVDTPMIHAVSSNSGRFRPSGVSPLGRVAQPDDVAAAIEFYVGPAASYITGTILPIDGGTSAAYQPPGT